MILTTLVIGGSLHARESAIAQALVPGVASAVILEGLSDGNAVLADHGCAPHVVRIAPGCLCCVGSTILRVTLNRILRQRPARLFISLANGEHAGQLQQWLSQPPYDDWLTLDQLQVH